MKKMAQIGPLSMKKLVVIGQVGKLWIWKRSHYQWLLQFKWKWQKPWRLSEWIRHNDETIMRARPRPQVLTDKLGSYGNGKGVVNNGFYNSNGRWQLQSPTLQNKLNGTSGPQAQSQFTWLFFLGPFSNPMPFKTDF